MGYSDKLQGKLLNEVDLVQSSVNSCLCRLLVGDNNCRNLINFFAEKIQAIFSLRFTLSEPETHERLQGEAQRFSVNIDLILLSFALVELAFAFLNFDRHLL